MRDFAGIDEREVGQESFAEKLGAGEARPPRVSHFTRHCEGKTVIYHHQQGHRWYISSNRVQRFVLLRELAQTTPLLGLGQSLHLLLEKDVVEGSPSCSGSSARVSESAKGVQRTTHLVPAKKSARERSAGRPALFIMSMKKGMSSMSETARGEEGSCLTEVVTLASCLTVFGLASPLTLDSRLILMSAPPELFRFLLPRFKALQSSTLTALVSTAMAGTFFGRGESRESRESRDLMRLSCCRRSRRVSRVTEGVSDDSSQPG